MMTASRKRTRCEDEDNLDGEDYVVNSRFPSTGRGRKGRGRGGVGCCAIVWVPGSFFFFFNADSFARERQAV